MGETIAIVSAIIGAVFTWTASVAAVIIYLEKRFTRLEVYIRRDMRAMELEIRKSMQEHHDEDNDRFYDYGTRVQRLEIHSFGVTQTGRNPL